jgi:hypothetical protein
MMIMITITSPHDPSGAVPRGREAWVVGATGRPSPQARRAGAGNARDGRVAGGAPPPPRRRQAALPAGAAAGATARPGHKSRPHQVAGGASEKALSRCRC